MLGYITITRLFLNEDIITNEVDNVIPLAKAKELYISGRAIAGNNEFQKLADTWDK